MPRHIRRFGTTTWHNLTQAAQSHDATALETIVVKFESDSAGCNKLQQDLGGQQHDPDVIARDRPCRLGDL